MEARLPAGKAEVDDGWVKQNDLETKKASLDRILMGMVQMLPELNPLSDLPFGELPNRAKHGNLAKLDTALATAVLQHENGMNAASYTGNSKSNHNKILVEVIATTENGLWEKLQEHGMQVVNCYKHLCSAYASISSLVSVSSLDVVNFVQKVQVHAHAGSVESEGDEAMYANIARATFGLNGTGIKIGVISVSYNCLLAQDIATGDLPNDVQVVNDLSYPTECLDLGGTDKGQAMLQIIH